MSPYNGPDRFRCRCNDRNPGLVDEGVLSESLADSLLGDTIQENANMDVEEGWQVVIREKRSDNRNNSTVFAWD